MIYAIVGALVTGLSLGVFGSGGSILTVPVLLYLLHHEDKVAIAESLGIVGSIALISALPYAREKLVDWRTAFVFGAPGMLGTYGGAWLAGYVPGFVQLFVFAGVMLCAALMMWKRSTRAAPPHHEQPKRAAVKIVPEGLGVGMLTGFVGVGGGFLIVPALVLLGGLPMRRAVATSLAIIAMNSAVGFWKYLHVLDGLDLAVNWNTIGLFILVGAVGSLAGKTVSGKLKQAALQRGFAVFLVLMALFIIVREGNALVEQSPQPAQLIDQPNGANHGNERTGTL